MKTVSSPDKLDQTFNFFFLTTISNKNWVKLQFSKEAIALRYSLSSVSVPKVQNEDGGNTENPNKQREDTEKEDSFDKMLFARNTATFFLTHWTCAFSHIFLELRLRHGNN